MKERVERGRSEGEGGKGKECRGGWRRKGVKERVERGRSGGEGGEGKE